MNKQPNFLILMVDQRAAANRVPVRAKTPPMNHGSN